MRVHLGTIPAEAVGGMNRVYKGLHKYLPQVGVEIVDSIQQADVVNAHIALYDTIPVDKPLVVSSHGLLWGEHAWGKYAWEVNHLAITSYLQADVVTCPSYFIRQAIARHTMIPSEVVYHGIDIEEWTPQQPEGYVLWNKARLDAACNPEDLDRLASLLPEQLFVTTYGSQASNVHVVGSLPHANMKKLIQGASVYLLTSKESGGPCFGLLEAMACGIPTLSWDFGGTSEAIIHGETGYLAEPYNYTDLMEGLQFCLRDRERLGANARQHCIDTYQWKDTVLGYVRAYEKAIQVVEQPAVKVSVVITDYNLAEYLPAAIQSVQNQTYSDWELLVVDDCSTDNSQEVLQAFKDDPRITIIKNEVNEHVSYSRNIGVLKSKGKYILPLDADDELLPDALEVMVKELDSDRRLHVVTGGPLMLRRGDAIERSEWPNEASYENQIHGYNRYTYSSMFRRKVWENLGGYRTRIRTGIEDADFWTRTLSYGYAGKIIPNHPTLLYTLRGGSLGSTHHKPASAWLSWFPWSYEPSLTPLGAAGKGPYPATNFSPVDISVIIPVGPGHEKHLQTCLDSLLAQTFTNWEAVVINDTGKRWFGQGGKVLNPCVYGTSFARIIDGTAQHGVAYARNRGIEQAKGKVVVFLDVDDVAQPNMLLVLLKALSSIGGGWVYGDWYKIESSLQDPILEHAKDWDVNEFLKKMLAPITGAYYKSDLELVDGFDEDAPGWEDWDLQLSLFEKGICGIRVEFPLITYHMHLGARREECFDNREHLIEYIQNKHAEIYQRLVAGEDLTMCCGKGKANTLSVKTVQQNSKASNPTLPADTDTVLLRYVGNEIQTRRVNSKHHKGSSYRFSGNSRTFWVFKDDAVEMVRNQMFEYATQSTVTAAVETAPIQTEVLVSDALPGRPQQHEYAGTFLTELNLAPEIITTLVKKYGTIEEVEQASDADLLTIKGIGASRLAVIRNAVGAWKSGLS